MKIDWANPGQFYRVAMLALLAATATAFLWVHRFDVIPGSAQGGAFIFDRWSRTAVYCDHASIKDRHASRCRDFYPATWDAVREATMNEPRPMTAEEAANYNAVLRAYGITPRGN